MLKKILLSFSLALLFSNILFIDADNVLIGDGGDNYEFFGFMHIARENMLSGRTPFSHTNILRYPNGFDFSYGFDGIAPVFTGAVLGMIISPILAYNFTVVLILFANIFCSIYFFEKLGSLNGLSKKEEGRYVLAGLIFGASPYVFARLNSHLNLSLIAGIPAVIYYIALLHKNIVQDEDFKSLQILISAVLSIIFVGLGSLQYLILLFLISSALIFVIFKNYFSKYKKFITDNLKPLLLSSAFLLIMFLLFWGGYARAVLTSQLSMVDRASKFVQPHPADIFLPNQYLGQIWGLLNHSGKSIEKVVTVGIVELLILGVVLCKINNTKERLFGFSIFLLYIFLSFGVINLPFFHEGGRSVIFISLYIATSISTKNNLFKNRLVVWLLITAALTQRLFFNMQTSVPLAAKTLEDQVSRLPGRSVLNVPLSKYNAYRTALPVFYRKSIIDGFFHYTAESKQTQETMQKDYFKRMICASERVDYPANELTPQARKHAIKTFQDNDVSAVVVFKNQKISNFLSEDCSNVRDWWYYLNPESIVLSKETKGIKKQTAQLRSYNSNNIVRLYFQKAGKIFIDGIFISPEGLDQFTVLLPDGNHVNPKWTLENGGQQVKFAPVLEYEGKAGDSIYIQNNQKSDQSRYVNVYYSFTPDNNKLENEPLPFDLLYSDYDVEIYKVNY